MRWYFNDWEAEKRTNHCINQADIWEEFITSTGAHQVLLSLLEGDPSSFDMVHDAYDEVAEELIKAWEEDRAEDKLLERKQGPIKYGELIR